MIVLAGWRDFLKWIRKFVCLFVNGGESKWLEVMVLLTSAAFIETAGKRSE